MQNLNDIVASSKFAEAIVALNALIERLSTSLHAPIDATSVEALIARDGQEVMRILLQGWFTQRAALKLLELKAMVLEKGQQVRVSTRSMESRFGRIQVSRPGLKMAGERRVFALDQELNLPLDLYSHTVRQLVSEEASRGSFDEVGKALSRYTGAHVPKRQREELVVRSALDFEAFNAQRRIENDNASTLSKQALLVASCDSKGVAMIEESLRPHTQKKKQEAKAKGKRDAPLKRTGGHRHDKRMAIVTAVFEQEPHERTANDVVTRMGAKNKLPSKQAPRAQRKHVEASLISQRAGIASMYDEVERRDASHERTLVVLVDGEERQLKEVKREAKQREIKQVIILDLMHVLHYLWHACHSLAKKREAKTFILMQLMLQKLLTGPANYVAGALRQRATNLGLSAKQRKAVDTCCGYLLKNQSSLNYAEYLEKGYPIATGVIEGACRHLVQDRMGITGARWGLETAEAVLRLRAIRTNGDWDAYWHFHQRQEFIRNYARAA